MKWLNRFIPPFFKKLDHYLLVNYPSIWSTRFHTVAFAGIAFSILLSLICFALPMNYWDESAVPFLIGLIIIISLLSVVVWIVFLLRFNPFKRFADDATVRRPGSTLLTFLLYMGVMLIFCFWSFIPPIIETFRTYRQIAASEVVNDVNTVNLNIASLEFDTSYFRFSRDTTLYSLQISNRHPEEAYYDEQEAPYRTHFSYGDFSRMEEDIALSDSCIKLDDSLYVFLIAPRLTFLSAKGLPSASSTHQWTDKELFHLARNNHHKINREKCFQQIATVLKKYDRDWTDFHMSRKTYRKDIRVGKHEDIDEKYEYYSANSQIGDVDARMLRWEKKSVIIYAHIVLYISCLLSLLVFMFRHTTKKVFFLSFLIGFLVFVLSALLLALLRLYSDLLVQYMCLGYFFLFVLIALCVFWSKHRKTGVGIAINFTLLSLPALPILITVIYFEHLSLLYPYEERTGEIKALFEAKDTYMMYSELAGLLLLLVLIEPLFKKLYTRWYALPEE